MKDFISAFITDAVNHGINFKSTTDIRPSNGFRRIAALSDKAGKKSISYWLKIEHDFAYGYVKDFKSGVDVRFNSAASDPGMTKGDIARVKAMLKARKAQEDIKIAERHEKIAARAKIKWGQASSHGTTPYLERKGISLDGARIYGESALMVPVLNDWNDLSRPVSWQMIYQDGEKKFPFGGQKSGCWSVTRQIDPTKPILICEGWATGKSIDAALDRGVVVAFDAGNLLDVAKEVRKYYKTTPIIIAADNDESGTGQKAAQKCMSSVPNTSIVMPKEVGHDFNDLPPDAIKIAFCEKPEGGDAHDLPDCVGMQTSIPADWQSWLITDGKQRIVATSLQNAILYMTYHTDFAGTFAYDEFRQEVMVVKCPPWQEENKFKVEGLHDIHITKASATLERYGLTCTIDKTAKAIDVVADENSFHSARQYLMALEWDGIPRLETACQTFFGTTQEATPYLAFIFKKWLTASVKRVMEPGCKFDHVLILESQKQGLYKSEFLKQLGTFNGERYHTDSIAINDLSNKDTVMKMQGNLIVELAELSGTSRKEDGEIKNWMTQTLDEVRIPFARKTVTYKRQFVFASTTNNYDYLRDPTGNRRYWPVTVDKIIDIEALEAVKGQLWAEAVFHYNNGLYIGPTPEENELAEIERGKRLQSDAWEDIVLRAVGRIGLDEFKISDVLEKMDLKTNEKNERAVRRISAILKGNGFVNDPRWDKHAGKSVRLWSKSHD